MRITSMIFLISCIAMTAASTIAQTITINSVSGTNFCLGDSISVTFTVSGNWSQNKNNAFTIQLSDANGSFDNKFTNFGSLKDTADGTFTLAAILPYITNSTHFRIRISGAYPYVASADNGHDITIGRQPNLDLEISDFTTPIATSLGTLNLPVGAQVGSSVQILLPTDPLYPDPLQNTTNYAWDFGSGATPPNASGYGAIEEYVSYSTPGDKTVSLTLTGPTGCAKSAQIEYHIFDCSKPAIPKHAVVDSGNLHGMSRSVIWVNPGVAFGVDGTGDTIFCESNSSIYDRGGGNVIYLKPGATYSDLGHGSYSTIIYANGVSLDLHNPNYNEGIRCPDLDFDYTNAPPNAAHPSSSVKNDLNSASITLFPNPTNGVLMIQGLQSDYVTVSVFNTLGETVMLQKNPPAPDFTLDLSRLVPGSYYIRFSSANSVVTKKVVRD